MRYAKKKVKTQINWAETLNQVATEGGKLNVQVSISNEDLAKVAGVGIGLILFNAMINSQQKKK